MTGGGVLAAMRWRLRCIIQAEMRAVSNITAPNITGIEGALNWTADAEVRSESVIGALTFSNAPPPRSAYTMMRAFEGTPAGSGTDVVFAFTVTVLMSTPLPSKISTRYPSTVPVAAGQLISPGCVLVAGYATAVGVGDEDGFACAVGVVVTVAVGDTPGAGVEVVVGDGGTVGGGSAPGDVITV